MTPDQLRTWSLRTFKATIYFAVAGVIIIIALPNPAFADSAGLAVKVTAWAGLACLVIAMISNIVSLVTGSEACSALIKSVQSTVLKPVKATAVPSSLSIPGCGRSRAAVPSVSGGLLLRLPGPW